MFRDPKDTQSKTSTRLPKPTALSAILALVMAKQGETVGRARGLSVSVPPSILTQPDMAGTIASYPHLNGDLKRLESAGRDGAHL